MKTEESKKQVSIQKRIEEVMKEEFDKMIEEYAKDPLLELIRKGQIDRLSLSEIKTYLGGSKE